MKVIYNDTEYEVEIGNEDSNLTINVDGETFIFETDLENPIYALDSDGYIIELTDDEIHFIEELRGVAIEPIELNDDNIKLFNPYHNVQGRFVTSKIDSFDKITESTDGQD